MPCQALDGLTTVGIPDDRDPIVAGADDELRVGRERDPLHRSRVRAQTVDLLSVSRCSRNAWCRHRGRRPVSGRRG